MKLDLKNKGSKDLYSEEFLPGDQVIIKFKDIRGNEFFDIYICTYGKNLYDLVTLMEDWFLVDATDPEEGAALTILEWERIEADMTLAQRFIRSVNSLYRNNKGFVELPPYFMKIWREKVVDVSYPAWDDQSDKNEFWEFEDTSFVQVNHPKQLNKPLRVMECNAK